MIVNVAIVLYVSTLAIAGSFMSKEKNDVEPLSEDEGGSYQVESTLYDRYTHPLHEAR